MSTESVAHEGVRNQLGRTALDATGVDLAARPRWRGQPRRLEVWYATISDTATGTGLWIHHELVARVDGPAYAHGWVGVFPADGTPCLERFGPEGAVQPVGTSWFAAAGSEVGSGHLRGAIAAGRWDLRWSETSPPLFTIPRWAWRRDRLPAAQVVVAPSAVVSGHLAVGGHSLELAGASGAVAHIYGDGNPERWSWLHADLGHGDVLEVVAAVSRHAGLRRLPPLAFVRLRVGGRDWPRDSLAAAPLFRVRLGLPEWSIRGIVGTHRLTVSVRQPPGSSVEVPYADPDGRSATCTNTERGDADVRLDRWRGGWQERRRWQLAGTAHAEVGTRP